VRVPVLPCIENLSDEAYRALEEALQHFRRTNPQEGTLDESIDPNELTLKDYCRALGVDFKAVKDYLLAHIETQIETAKYNDQMYRDKLQDYDHQRSIQESVAQLPSNENLDKLIKYERFLQHSIEKNVSLLRSLQSHLQLNFGFVRGELSSM
jgi:hypothetical protein